MGNAKSPWLEVVRGTTQGTVLGFLLFLLFIKDLPATSSPEDESLVMLLADDTNSFQEISREAGQQAEDQQSLQLRIDRTAQWARDWKMEIHPEKSKILHIGRENPDEWIRDSDSVSGEGYRILDFRTSENPTKSGLWDGGLPTRHVCRVHSIKGDGPSALTEN